MARRTVRVLVAVVVAVVLPLVLYAAISASQCGTAQTWSWTQGCHPWPAAY